MAKDNIKIVKINTDPATKSLKDLRKELKGFKDEMANLEEGSDAFLEVANKAGEVKHQIDEINESVKGASSDFGDMLGNVTNVAAGLVGAFTAVQGALQAMGVENEVIEESIKKMQGLMAVVQGLSSIDTAIKSMDKLRKSITSTTTAAKLLKAALQPKVFIAITAAVSGLVAVFSKYKKDQEAIAELEKKRNEESKQRDLERRIAHQKELNALLETEVNLTRTYYEAYYGEDRIAATKSTIKSFKKQVEDLKKLNPQTLAGDMLIAWTDMQNYLGEDPLANIQTEHVDANVQAYQQKMQELLDLVNPNPKLNDPEYREMEARYNQLVAQYDALRFRWEDNQQKITSLEALIQAEDEKLEVLETQQQAREDAKRANKGKTTDESIDKEIEQLKRKGLTEVEFLEELIKLENKRLGIKEKGSVEEERQLTKIYDLEKKLEQAKTDTTRQEIDKQIAMWKHKVNTETEINEEGQEVKKYTMADYYDEVIKLEEQWLGTLEDESEEYYNQLSLIESLKNAKLALSITDETETTDTSEQDDENQRLLELAKSYYMTHWQLARENEERIKADLDKALENKLISQEEYDKAVRRLESERAMFIAQNTMDVFATTTSAISSILDQLAADTDTNNKEGFEKSKKLQIASATMNMLTGIIAAWNSSMALPAPFSFITGAIQTAATATLGALQIKKIKETKFNGSGDSSLNAGAVNATIIPPVQYSTAVQGASTVGAIKDSKVYVTETDIVSTMNKVSVQEVENTY